MNVPKILFNILIIEGTSKMLHTIKGEFKEHNISGKQEKSKIKVNAKLVPIKGN